jgi:NADH dehydrogenase
MTKTPIRVVIIGAGYTGIWAYKFLAARLGGKLKNGDVTVTVIAPKTYHSFHGWTAESLTGIISIANRQSPLRRLFKGQNVLQAKVVCINTENKTVSAEYLSDGRVEEIPFDHLLIANGSYDNMESVKGLHQFGYTVKASGGVAATRNQLLRLIETADSLPAGAEQDKWMTVVVAGGGFAGVEFSSNIAEMYEAYKKFYPVLQKRKVRVVLVHSGDKLLPVLRPRYDGLADYCTDELKKYGIEIYFNTRLAEVTDDGALLSNGEFIPTKTVLSTVGQRPTILKGTESLPRTSKGLVIADEFLHVEGHDNIWIGGDAAQVMHKSGVPCPANALWAIMHGKWTGENIAYTILGKKLKPFNYWGLGQAASLGVGKGASELYTVQLKGWIGWLARFFFFLYFQPSRRQAVRVFGDWMTLAFLGRYMSISSEWQREPEAHHEPVA